MRFYQLSVQDDSGRMLQVEKSGLGFAWTDVSQGPTFSSVYTSWQTGSQQSPLNGQPNPNALQVYFDLPVYPFHAPQGNALLRVWGLGIKCLSQAANLNPVGTAFKTFALRAGMSKGLPLANPKQQGVVATGIVYQAFGNWTGTEQTLDMIVQAYSDLSAPISWSWPRGTSLQSALQQMFSQAFPDYDQVINISATLVAPVDDKGLYPDIYAFAKHLHARTKRWGAQANGTNYDGVSLIALGGSIYATDGAGPAPAKTVALQFRDLVGQPTWIAANTITFQTVLRGDINWGDSVTFPSGVLLPYALTAPEAAYPGSPAASSSSFQGTFIVNQDIHFYGAFRQEDAASWNTTYTATFVPATS